MIRNLYELLHSIRQTAEFGSREDTRIVFREGEFGPERALEHVKVRQTMRGLEIILQGSATPLDG